MSACRYKLKQDQYLIFGSVTRKFVLFLGFSVSVFFFFFIAASLRCLVIVTDALIFFLQFMWKMKFFGTNKEIPLPSLSLCFFFSLPPSKPKKGPDFTHSVHPSFRLETDKGISHNVDGLKHGESWQTWFSGVTARRIWCSLYVWTRRLGEGKQNSGNGAPLRECYLCPALAAPYCDKKKVTSR